MGEVSRRGVLGGLAGSAALTAIPLGVPTAHAGAGGPMWPIRLTTEHVADPLGIDVAEPRFGWQLDADGRNRAQRAYQVLVASTTQRASRGRGDVWDSGRVESAEQSAQPYGGPPLRSRTRYYWAVRVWDEAGRRGPLSEVARFETALLSQREWTAEWVGSGVVLPPPVRTLRPGFFRPDTLQRGHTLGQRFDSPSKLAAVAVLLGVPPGERAGCVMTLRRDGPTGAVLGRQVLSELTGDRFGSAQGRLDLSEPAEAGTLFLELSDPRGSVDWIGIPYDDPADDPYDPGSGYEDGKAVRVERWLYGIPPDPPADPLLRTEFGLDAPVASARLYLAGLGLAKAWLNGRRVGEGELSPVCTDYDRRVLYTTHDVTSLLRRGRNALGVALGRGFFATRAPDSDATHLSPWIAEPQVKAQLEVTFADGRRTTIGSGPDWSLTEGPTTYDGLYTGESYDARRARDLDGWTEPRYPAEARTGWRPAAVVDDPGGRLEAYAAEPIRAGRPIGPVSVRRPADGVRLYDFGVVLTGWVRLRGRLPKGTTVRMLYSEKLGPSGRIEVGTPGGNENVSVVGRFQVDEYTADGNGAQVWQPSFTYKGFRYVEVSGADRPLDLVAVPVGSGLSETMDVRLDHPVLQWIVDAFRRTARNGLHGLPDVSPMYSKFGWTGNAHFASQPMLYLFGMAGLFDKWLDDIRLSQAPDGELPIIAPVSHDKFGGLSPAWTGVYPHLVHHYWRTYGDRTVPAKHYEAVRRYVEWLLAQLRNGIASDQFGDWYPPQGGNPVPPEGTKLVGTAYVIKTLRDATAVADLLGHDEQARAWRARTNELTRRFNEEFFGADAGVYRTDAKPDPGYRQTSNAVPLAFGLVPSEHVEKVAANLATAVEDTGHLDTGCAGISALPYALTDNGRADLAHLALGRRDYPSYGHLRDLGATTLWESWEPTSRGHNDTLFGSPVRWLVERVLGVEALEPGWARFRVAPRAFGTLRHAGAALDTVRGRIEVSWRRRHDGLVLRVRVPVNAVAELTLPDGEQRELGSGKHRIETPTMQVHRTRGGHHDGSARRL